MSETAASTDGEDKRKLYENYASFSKILGTWLATYGIAFLVFSASQKSILVVLKSDIESAKYIMLSVLIGLGAQIFSTMIYKACFAYLAHGELKPVFKDSRRYKFFDKIYYAYWFESLMDIITVTLYFYATYSLALMAINNA